METKRMQVMFHNGSLVALGKPADARIRHEIRSKGKLTARAKQTLRELNNAYPSGVKKQRMVDGEQGEAKGDT